MFIKCSDFDSHDIYKILLGTIVPRPIAWVSTTSNGGINNLAPFSFFNCFGADPPMVGFAPAYKSIEETASGVIKVPKDTLRNVEETGEFVVNIVSYGIGEKMNRTSAEYDATISEFEIAGLTPVGSDLVRPPRVLESPANLECKLINVIRHGNNNLVLGEVVAIHISDAAIDSKLHVNAEAVDAIGRMAGNWYATTRDRFEMKRPKA